MGAGVDQSTQTGLGVVAEEAADLDQARRHGPAADRNRHFAIIIAQVAALRAGAEVHPFAHITMAQETVMILVGMALDNTRLDLAADPAIGAEGRAGTNRRAQDLRTRTDI